MKEVAEHLTKETLKRLKNEYGGLQTLLKNNHQVFEGKEGRFVFLHSSILPPPSAVKSQLKNFCDAGYFKLLSVPVWETECAFLCSLPQGAVAKISFEGDL